jgi:cytochrome c-type biogenesis protein CcmH
MTLGIIFGVMLVLALALVLVPLLAPQPVKKGAKGSRHAILVAALGGAVAAAAVGLYLELGRPELGQTISPRVPGDASTAEGPSLPSIEVMVERLEARLADNPGDLNGWATLGQSQMVLGRYSEAVETYRKAVALGPNVADLHSALGEALTLAADGAVTPDALASFQKALGVGPNDAVARFYLGDHAFQQGDVEQALDRWTELYRDAPADTPWLSVLEERIREASGELGREPPAILAEKAGANPPASAMEAIQQMDPDEQQAMIENMVVGLAERLKENPDDLEGWARLGRSYMVLQRPELAAEAYAHVVAAKPGDKDALEQYAQALLAGLAKENQPVSDEAKAALGKLEQLDSENTTALYFLGQAAVERNDPAAAKTYWRRLLAVLSPTSEDARMVQEKLDALP